MPLRPPVLDPLFPAPGTRLALDEWVRHQRLCVAAVFLDVAGFSPPQKRMPRIPDLPSDWIADEARLEVVRSMGRPPGHDAGLDVLISDRERLVEALGDYQRRSIDLTAGLMLLALVAGVLVHGAFAGLVISVAWLWGTPAAVVPLALWIVGMAVAREVQRVRVAPFVFP